MNRPRNKQPRGNKTNYSNPKNRNNPRAAATPQQASGTVPSTAQVMPGAAVYIILKQDQPTGKETHGIVQELLTRGNHPRGIKVRLRDGQVGRVQRLASQQPAPENQAPEQSDDMTQRQTAPGSGATAKGGRISHKYSDVRADEYAEPPPRSLADFLPPSFDEAAQGQGEAEWEAGGTAGGTAGVDCPFCADFKGDETAVTVHIEREHLS